MAIISIPQEIAVSPLASAGGSTLSITISVDQAGGSVQFDTDQRSILQSPSGSWPCVVSYAQGGPTSKTVEVNTTQVLQSTQAKVYASRSDVDITNPANWSAEKTCTISPPSGTPGMGGLNPNL